MNLTLHVWRQKNAKSEGRMVEYEARDVSEDMSFLEMLDVVNESLIERGEEPIAFDHDCREGICGMCGMMINGVAHGPERATTTCQLHMRHFSDGDTIDVEPWRHAPSPPVQSRGVVRRAVSRLFLTARSSSAPIRALPGPP